MRERDIEAFASRAETTRTDQADSAAAAAESQVPQDPKARMKQRLNSGRKVNILNVLGTESVKELVDYAAEEETNGRIQDLVRKYLILELEKKYGALIPPPPDRK